jgi:hypothetical protein
LAAAGLDSFVVPVTNAWAASIPLVTDATSAPPINAPNGSKNRSGARDQHTTTHSSSDVVSVRVSLLSRRSRHRQGQRYIKRGSDGAGDVANFVETEQIVYVFCYTIVLPYFLVCDVSLCLSFIYLLPPACFSDMT